MSATDNRADRAASASTSDMPVTDSRPDGIALAAAAEDSRADGIALAAAAEDSRADGISLAAAAEDSRADGISLAAAAEDSRADGIALSAAAEDSRADSISLAAMLATDSRADGIALAAMPATDSRADGISLAATAGCSRADDIALAARLATDSRADGIALAATAGDSRSDGIALAATAGYNRADDIALAARLATDSRADGAASAQSSQLSASSDLPAVSNAADLTRASPKQQQECVDADFARLLEVTVSRYRALSEPQQTALLERLLAVSRPRQRWHLAQRLPALLLRDFLTLLPREMVEQLLAYVDGVSLLQCCRVSSAWNRIISSLDSVWRDKCRHLGVRAELGSVHVEAAGGWKELFVGTQRTLWRMKKRRAFEKVTLRLPNGAGGKVIALDHDGEQLVAAAEPCHLSIWRLDQCLCVLAFAVFAPISCVKFTCGKLIVCGHYNGQLSSYDISDTGEDGERAAALRQRLQRAATAPDADERAEAGARLLRRFWVHSGPVFCLDYSEELDVLVSGAADNTAKLFSLSSGLLLNTLPRHSHWVVRVLLHRRTDSTLLLTMTRDEIQVFEAEPSPAWLPAEPFKSLRSPRLTVPLAEPLPPQPGMHIPFFTPGCHLHATCITFVRQSPPTNNKISTASLVQYELGSRHLSTRIVVSFKVKKLLAIGSRYALLLAPYAQESCPNLYFVSLDTKEVIASEKVPHSRLSTPDAAQIATGELSWLDGFDGPPPEGALIAAMGTEVAREVLLLRWHRP